ncbi:unnamed protein product [Rotaria sp. Silwood1]|nr:unnamed protein product [Rotaria sp. Silwood1]CAF1391218.1 unnamed protein product [Rotaria sp. Silwood1]CAF3561055.1 unnamed protein product [Rotaria sp. Silwood1]CAF3624274.1 unnamed protein product [Rotaria sp. Silwood1]CAF4661560.1 unnamed protein product [Rotaria sp. Silwood1]
MIFDTLSPTDHMFESLPSSFIEHPLTDECNFSQIESIKQKMVSNRQDNSTSDMHAITNRYHQLKSSPMNQSLEQIEKTTVANIDEESTNSLWQSSDEHHLSISPTKSLAMTEFYPNSSSSSSDLSLINSDSHHDDKPEMKTLSSSSSSSGYESSLNSISDHFFPSSPDSIIISNCNLVEQFINLHLPKQSSYDHDIPFSSASSLSSLSSSFFSQDLISTSDSPSSCRKFPIHNQLSSDTDDDSQATTISTDVLFLQRQKDRPRSLPIAIQQSKVVLNDDDTDNSSQNNSLCYFSLTVSEKICFQKCESSSVTATNGIFSTNHLITTSIDKLDINEQLIINSKNSLEHFIMSPTDKVKIQMKYHENDIKNNELKISQPEDIDFKRSKLKAIRVLYQNRVNFNKVQSPVTHQNSTILSSRTASYCHSPLAKRTVSPRFLRSVLSCSVFEVDDEHEVVSSTTQNNVNGTREKSHIETFNFLRGNFTESLLHGKILPSGILDGFTVKLGASGLFIPKQVILPVTTFWFNVSEHQAASPYLGYINLQCLPKRGYHTPTKGTITLALLNPNGTAVHLFLILYDLSDMPPDHRTFIRQRVVHMPEDINDDKTYKKSTMMPSKENLRYLAHICFVTSQTGKLYMHSDIRLIFARNKLDYDERTGNGKPQLVTTTDMPTPKYWSRK